MEEDPNPPIPLWIVSVVGCFVGWGLTFGLAWLLHPVFLPSVEMTTYPSDGLGHLSALVSVTFLGLALWAYMIGAHWGRLWADWKGVIGGQAFWALFTWSLYFRDRPVSPEAVCGFGSVLLIAYWIELERKYHQLSATKNNPEKSP